jgi:DNA-binding NarL/FixJ family response regulator
VKVGLVDDHPVFRQGLRAVLESQPDIQVIGEASDAKQGYQLAEQRPDVMVVDVRLPGTDGIEATRELRRRAPRCRVLMLSMCDDREYVARAIAAGASGYLLKRAGAEEVLNAIREVARGACPLPAGWTIESLQRQSSDNPLSTLSQRESEVFRLLVRGFTNRDVSRELCISVKTVETHRANIHRKLDVHSVAALLHFAARHGLIEQ